MTHEYLEKAAIQELFSSYCFCMDDGDFAGVAALFVADGEWIANYERARGREEIETLLTRINPERGVGPFRKHVIANSLIELAGDAATARTSYLVLMQTGSGPAPIIVGTYADSLVCDPDEGWRLSRRELVHEITSDDLALRL